jgi:hypothetical protein
MRHSLLGVLATAGLVIAVTAGRGVSESPIVPQGARVEFPAFTSPSSELITHVTAVDGQPQTVVVIDPRQRVMAVYHVSPTTGEITPKSVRNFTWDLQMIEYNSGNPLPQDIRSGLQR